MITIEGIWGYIICGVGSLLLGYYLTFHAGADHLEYVNYTKTWPSTQGVITLSEIKESTNGEGKPSYYFHLRYKYSVDGKEFSDNTISHSEKITFNKKYKAVKLRER